MMAGRGSEGKECGSDKMVKDRGRTWGVACLAGLGSVWVERIQSYRCTEALICTDTNKIHILLSPTYITSQNFDT